MEQGGAGRWSDAELHGALARVFGYTAFRPHQIEIVKGILGGHDSLSIMPTGGGKSLCFQLPSHLMDGVCVVISPLISLMKDQVDAACANGLRAAALNSSLSPGGHRAVREALASGELDLLYISPERLSAPGFWDARLHGRFLSSPSTRRTAFPNGDMISARIIWRFPGLSSGSPNARWRRSRLRPRPRWSETSFPGSACGSPG